MKKIIIVFLTLLLYPAIFIAQNLSVYGVTLGDNIYNVKNVLERKGKEYNSGTNSQGVKYLSIKYPNIADLSFDGASFYFDDDNLLSGVGFYSSDGGTGTPGMPWENAFHRKSQECENTFQTMKQNLIIKYGSPNTESENRIIWQRKNQKIVLEYNYKFDTNQYGWIDHWVSVGLEYEKIDVNSLDY